jgi:hypothetical protein
MKKVFGTDRLNWLREVAYNFARVTNRYDRSSIWKVLSDEEKLTLMRLEIEETKKYTAELNRDSEVNKLLIACSFPIAEA